MHFATRFTRSVKQKSIQHLPRIDHDGMLQVQLGALILRADDLDVSHQFLWMGIVQQKREVLGGFISEHFPLDRKSTRLNSSHANISYAVFCLKIKKKRNQTPLLTWPLGIQTQQGDWTASRRRTQVAVLHARCAQGDRETETQVYSCLARAIYD